MTSITPDDEFAWHEHQASWSGIAVAFVTVLVAYASIALL